MIGVGDAEADGDGEIGVLADEFDALLEGEVVELLAFAGDADAGEEVDEAGALIDDLADALRGGGGSNEECEREVVEASEACEWFGGGEIDIRDDEAIEAGGGGIGGELLRADASDDGIADHGDEAEVGLGADAFDGFKDFAGSDAGLEGLMHGGGDDGAIGDGIGERNAEFGEGGAGLLEGGDDLGGDIKRGIASRDEGHEGSAFFGAKVCEDGWDAGQGIND